MKGFEGMGNMGQMMKQAQKMQKKMQEIQAEVEQTTVTASAGGGMVEVTSNGQGQIQSIKIDPEVVDPKDVEMLQDLILVATNDAQNRAKKLMEEKMSKLTGGLSIPGLENMF